jgi:hypothetical protein
MLKKMTHEDLMNQPSNDAGKKKALELALSQIQKQFGDGAIMTLGKHSTKQELSLLISLSESEEYPEDESLKFTALSHQGNQRSPLTLSRTLRKTEGLLHTSMRNMLSTQPTPRVLELISTTL